MPENLLLRKEPSVLRLLLLAASSVRVNYSSVSQAVFPPPCWGFTMTTVLQGQGTLCSPPALCGPREQLQAPGLASDQEKRWRRAGSGSKAAWEAATEEGVKTPPSKLDNWPRQTLMSPGNVGPARSIPKAADKGSHLLVLYPSEGSSPAS